MKTCKTCKKEKSFSEFYKVKQITGNYSYKPHCKICQAKNETNRLNNNPEAKAKRMATNIRWKQRMKNDPVYKQKTIARNIVTTAVLKGSLNRKPCKECGNTKVEAHHDDYSKPLDIIWFCKKDHEAYHVIR